MANFIFYKSFIDFFSANQSYITDDYFCHFTLIKIIEKHFTTEPVIVNAYNIVDGDKGFVIGVALEEQLIVYTNKWTEDIIDVFSKELEFDGLNFYGTKDFIAELFKYNGIDYEIFKDRIVYECVDVNNEIELAKGYFALATLDDINSVSELAYAYHLSEYKEDAFRDLENIKMGTERAIMANRFYKWQTENDITSIIQIVSEQHQLPIIGAFYTHEQHRGKGFGTSLLFSITKHLLSEGNKKCGLVSDATNLISNKLFEQVGYKNIYSTLSVNKKK
jgi:RimJ/RimL family protein N-acetyltransferase